MGQLVKGMRAGVLIHTTAGVFRNGSDPSKEQIAALKALGYKLEKSGETLEGITPITYTMRSEQLDAGNAGRKEADERADKVARDAAATQHQIATSQSAKLDGKVDEQKSDAEKNGDSKQNAGNE